MQVTVSPVGQGPQVLSPSVLTVDVAMTTLPVCLSAHLPACPLGCRLLGRARGRSPSPRPCTPTQAGSLCCVPGSSLTPVVCAHDGGGTWLSEPDRDRYKEGNVTSLTDRKWAQPCVARLVC